ncbi:fumarylacetoacetate hydrolase family protein [candidate division KSB1 bacterium]|nr:fumarylacetoacetate hydrolase family protein [candidate division KSB1 bacterium]
MKLAKIKQNGEIFWAADVENNFYKLQETPYHEIAVTNEIVNGEFKYLPPCDPSKIIGLAYNYKSLVGKNDGFDEPLVFLKGLNALVGHKDNVLYPTFATKVWIEVELAVVIKDIAKNITVKDVADVILGYTIGNDITTGNIHNRDHHLARSKSLDTFCPVGPYLWTDIDPTHLEIKSMINDQVTQEGNTADMILNAFECVACASQYFTLLPGDIILTGTTANAMNSIVIPGDRVELTIENFESLNNNIVEDMK